MKELAKLFEKLGFEIDNIDDSYITMESIKYSEENSKRIFSMVEYILKKINKGYLKGYFKMVFSTMGKYVALTYETYDIENDLKILGGLINE